MFVNTIHIVGDKQDLVNIELNDQSDVNAHCDVANATAVTAHLCQKLDEQFFSLDCYRRAVYTKL